MATALLYVLTRNLQIRPTKSHAELLINAAKQFSKIHVHINSIRFELDKTFLAIFWDILWNNILSSSFEGRSLFNVIIVIQDHTIHRCIPDDKKRKRKFQMILKTGVMWNCQFWLIQHLLPKDRWISQQSQKMFLPSFWKLILILLI